LNGTWGVDLEVKEISLAIDTSDGIVLIAGCSYPTIEKIVEAAQCGQATLAKDGEISFAVTAESRVLFVRCRMAPLTARARELAYS
jgi:metal-dependent hydrolase (beta-lactamase superfamily II)